jgi:hypothetical protein
MDSNDIQQSFFQQIKNLLPSHLSLANEVADLLHISTDSAYRRIRGETPLSFEEIGKLCSHYRISMDSLLHLKSDAFLFNGRITNASDFTFENWLETVVKHLEMIKGIKPCHLSYLAKEVPFMYYFLLPEIAAFKSFFFMKSILHYEEWKTAKFSVNDDYTKYQPIWKRISDAFSEIPSTEIWNVENITSTLHQIEFYRVTNVLKSNSDALCLLDKIEEMLAHIEKQAEYGVKLRYGQNPSVAGVPYKMFVNELIMGDNMQLVLIGNTHLTYINHSIINFITTQDGVFNASMKKTYETIAQKSTLISEVNEKDRLMFFNRLKAKVRAAKQLVQA